LPTHYAGLVLSRSKFRDHIVMYVFVVYVYCVCMCVHDYLFVNMCCHALLLCAQLFVWVCRVCVCLCVDNKQGPVSISESEHVCV